MATEDVSARYVDLDDWPTRDAVEAMFEGQLSAVAAVRPALGAISAAVDDAAEALRRGGRLVYAGAGTSGRVAVQDGAELPPTFDWPLDQLVFAMAGGPGALVKSAEGAEDDAADAIAKVDAAAIGPDDVVIGLAASGTTPYTVAFVRRATERGAVTLGMANNADAPLLAVARHPILIETGAEVVAGSTRMKAGTAQKAALNLFSTAVMIRLGRVYRGLMVHMRASNTKLHRRAEAMVAALAGCDEAVAGDALRQVDWDVKRATLVAQGLDPDLAGALIDRSGGSLRRALATLDAAGGASAGDAVAP
ncbi:N-acetylmuramic acid 6-phosphate etherase [Alsobacter metallidurans]|uniref:N-acetylmuramic acid 6-phosphate etherase n=1 Tax=Alsobacter metallidurans TaxID=340221 RepID=A0A917I4V7_9HYPH|nr:N-acetylmuramic acid 6-phosphate etherase [Alsobacter metallidurans]GGH09199.1 N-acetylmuramic acid 6-phosphate etherase [Alsobacter metallidurans]